MKPVKTLLLESVKTALENILGIDSVIRNPSKPIDRDTAKWDMIFVFDDTDKKSRRNRIAMNKFPLHIEIWIQKEDGTAISDQADIYEAEVHKIMTSDKDVLFYSMEIEDTSSDKFYAEDNLGGIVLRYEITYSHEWGNPYNMAKTR